MKDPLWMREDWKADCQRYIGHTLMGRFAHWCHEWDGLPVDETTSEFQCCNCWDETEAFLVAKREAPSL